MARRSAKRRSSKKNHVLRNLFLIICLIVVVIAVITYFQRKNSAKNADGSLVSQNVQNVTETASSDDGNGDDFGEPSASLQDLVRHYGSDSKSDSDKKAGSESVGGKSDSNKNVSDCDLGYEENDPLFFGNPSDAYFDASYEQNYLMEKENYTMSYNNSTLCANWVAWHLDGDDIGEAPRSNKFAADKALPDGWHQVTKGDYQFSAYGFDRGHLCPSADRTYNADANNETFLMTNMVPQSPDNNRVVWVALEKYQRQFVDNNDELYIFAGPAGTGGEGDKGFFEYIPVIADDGSELKINVPAYTWKIILSVPAGEDDLNRIDENATVIAVCVPNKKGINSDLSWKKYLCSVDDIENLTGFDFFELLDDDLEEALESRVISLSEL